MPASRCIAIALWGTFLAGPGPACAAGPAPGGHALRPRTPVLAASAAEQPARHSPRKHVRNPAGSATAADAFAPAEAMRARLGRLTRIEGRTESGGSVSTWAAYFRRDSLTWLRETVQLQDYVPRANEYFWAGGRLRTFLSSGAVSWTGKARERGPFTMAIAFDDSGRVVASRKKVNDVDAAIEPYEAAGALGRGEWLGALARQKRAVPGR